MTHICNARLMILNEVLVKISLRRDLLFAWYFLKVICMILIMVLSQLTNS